MSNEVELDTFVLFLVLCFIKIIMFPFELIWFVIEVNKERLCKIFTQLKHAMW